MLRAQRRALRTASQARLCDSHICRRSLGGGGRMRPDRGGLPTQRPPPTSVRAGQTVRERGDEAQRHRPQGSPQQPSLVEQLFPEENIRYEARQRAAREGAREVPRLPVDTTPVTQPTARRPEGDPVARSKTYQAVEARMEASGPVTSVLVLRNASPNLVEDDFRRLIPQGRHIEGWTLEQGDIIKVVPGRDLATLAQDGSYYLLFSSPLGAFTYQRHVTRIHHLCAEHGPCGDPDSPFSPPPGHVVDGIDVHAALSAYTLVPPDQEIELRQLKPPLSPMVDAIVRNGGFPSIVQRDGRMPAEARLTLEGPQLHLSRVSYILMKTGAARGLGWSGGDGAGTKVHVSRWEPLRLPSALGARDEPGEGRSRPWNRVLLRTEADQMERDYARMTRQGFDEDDDGGVRAQRRRRVPNPVYIVGFHTERAAQAFVQAWNRRPMTIPGEEEDGLADGDSPPIANVEMIW